MKVREFPMKNYYYEKVDKDIIDKVAEECFGTPFTLEFKDPYQIKQKEVDELIESWKRYQSQGIITASLKEEITWIDMAEKECIEDYKQKTIDTILMGDYKKEMKMKRNRLEIEVIALRDSTEENYMLNKMVNTDGNEFFAEYTLYKDYDKCYGLTLSGASINIVNIMEEEFAEFLHQYRLSITYPQVQAVHEDEDKYLEVDVNDLSGLTIEEYLEYVKLGMVPIQGVGSEDALMEDLIATVAKAKQLIEAYKRQLEEGKLAKFSPMYDEDDIEDEIELSGNIAGDSPYISSISSMGGISGTTVSKEHLWTETGTNTPSMWTETPTNTGEMTKNLWTETHANTGVSTNWTPAPQDIKDMEDNSKDELISKIVEDVIEELLTKGTCSLTITLGQE